MTWFVKQRRAQSVDDFETWIEGGVSPTLNAFDNIGDSRATVIIFDNSYRDGLRIQKGNTVNTLSAKMGTGGNNVPFVAREIEEETIMQVRRLTPIECERLMGWPDNHTLPRADGKQNADTTRYKMCGNGVASPVAAWIGTRLMEIQNAPRDM